MEKDGSTWLRKSVRPRWRRLWLAFSLNSFAVSVFLIIFLILGIGAGVSTHLASVNDSALASTAANVLGSLAASTIWFGIAYVLTKEYLAKVKEFQSLEEFPWEKYIAAHDRIEVNVHGWDGLMVGKGSGGGKPLMTARGKTWQQFFNNQGTLVLILPELPSTGESERDTASRRNLVVIAERNTKTLEEQRQEIVRTYTLARQLAANGNGTVELRHSRQLRWIFTCRFNDRLLLISPYTQRAKGQPFTEPAFLINLNVYSGTKHWVELLHQNDDDIIG